MNQLNKRLQANQNDTLKVTDGKLNSIKGDIESQFTSLSNQVHQSLENQLQRLKYEMKDELIKEIERKAASMKGQLQISKQEFFKAFNGNMKVLDNLVGEYTSKTQEQIKKQLQASGGPSNNGSVARSPSLDSNERREDGEQMNAGGSCQSYSEVKPISEISSQIVLTNREQYQKANHYFDN